MRETANRQTAKECSQVIRAIERLYKLSMQAGRRTDRQTDRQLNLLKTVLESIYMAGIEKKRY
jgi:hypothetical protein